MKQIWTAMVPHGHIGELSLEALMRHIGQLHPDLIPKITGPDSIPEEKVRELHEKEHGLCG